MSAPAVKYMLRNLGILACLALLLAACQGQAAPARTAESATAAPVATARDNIRVAVDPNFPPFVTRAGTQQFAGFDIDVMRAVAGRAGLGVTFVPVMREQLLNAVSKCSYDAAISAIVMTDALRQQTTLSQPYATVEHVLVIKKGNITITGTTTLADMLVGVEKGSPAASEVLNMDDAQPVLYRSADAAFEDLIKGNIEAVIADRRLAQSYVSIPANNLKIVGAPFGGAAYAIAVCKQRPEWARRIDEGLAAIKADGTLDKLTQKWLKAR